MRRSNFVLLLLLATLCGCAPANKPREVLTLATTTSTRDSGLLDVLVPRFEQQTGIDVKVVAVGTGQAMAMGRRGDADVLLTHAPAAEKEFVAQGHGTWRWSVMYNDFVVVGPPADPAGIDRIESVSEAFKRIAQTGAPFVSRGDESGTHMREKQIWQKAGIEPNGPWYLASGSGMGQTLRVAGEKRAYTLTDRSTFLAQQEGLDLVVLVEDDPLLQNHYAVIAVNPEKHPGVNHQGAVQFARFLLAPDTQQVIAHFGEDKYGQPLFHPAPEPATEGSQ